MLKISITDGVNAYDVIFTEKEVKVIKSDQVIAEISLSSAAAAIISQFIYEDI